MNQDQDHIQELISQLSLFACLPADAHQLLAQHAALETIRPNTTVFQRGDEGNSLYVIISGRVRVTLSASQDLSVLSDGDFFGEIAMLTRCHRTATITAETECTLLNLPAQVVMPLTQEHPAFQRQLGRTGAKRSEESMQKLMGINVPEHVQVKNGSCPMAQMRRVC